MSNSHTLRHSSHGSLLYLPNSAFNQTDRYEMAGLLSEYRINGGSSCKSCTHLRSQREFQGISESSVQMMMVQPASFHRPFRKETQTVGNPVSLSFSTQARLMLGQQHEIVPTLTSSPPEVCHGTYSKSYAFEQEDVQAAWHIGRCRRPSSPHHDPTVKA